MIFTDQLSRQLQLSSYPERIISVVPSQTELLFDLGLEEKVVGITKFCVHPEEWFRTKTRIGGTKNLNISKIQSLQPDLIIANKEENERSQIETLMEFAPVWVSDIKTLEDALNMIKGLGEVTGTFEKAIQIADAIQSSFNNIKNRSIPETAVYLIWKDPFMAAGSDTFINEMINRAGFQNAVKENRYPQLTVSQIKELKPDRVLLSSEPYPFNEEHIQTIKAWLPDAEVDLVDGELFSWYGSRLLKSAAYFQSLRNH